MKTSLLLLGLMAGAGILGTAQATDATTPLGSQTTTDATMADHGMMANLEATASSSDSQGNDSATSGSDADAVVRADMHYHRQPGPARTPESADSGTSSHHPDPSQPMSMHAGDNPAPSDTSEASSLGWQSLLPGSIQ